MLRSLKDLTGAKIGATDGELGKLTDLYFDDNAWILRYALVDINSWLPGGKVLIRLDSFGKPSRNGDVFGLKLSQQQIKEAPSLDADHPVSKQQQAKMLKHLNVPPFWQEGDFLPDDKTARHHAGTGAIQGSAGTPDGEVKYDPHLRSLKEIRGYQIRTDDEQVGDVHDLIANDDGWTIEHLIADTGTWLSGRKVVLETSGVKDVNWEDEEIILEFNRKRIEELPEYQGVGSLPEPRRKE